MIRSNVTSFCSLSLCVFRNPCVLFFCLCVYAACVVLLMLMLIIRCACNRPAAMSRTMAAVWSASWIGIRSRSMMPSRECSHRELEQPSCGNNCKYNGKTTTTFAAQTTPLLHHTNTNKSSQINAVRVLFCVFLLSCANHGATVYIIHTQQRSRNIRGVIYISRGSEKTNYNVIRVHTRLIEKYNRKYM